MREALHHDMPGVRESHGLSMRIGIPGGFRRDRPIRRGGNRDARRGVWRVSRGPWKKNAGRSRAPFARSPRGPGDGLAPQMAQGGAQTMPEEKHVRLPAVLRARLLPHAYSNKTLAAPHSAQHHDDHPRPAPACGKGSRHSWPSGCHVQGVLDAETVRRGLHLRAPSSRRAFLLCASNAEKTSEAQAKAQPQARKRRQRLPQPGQLGCPQRTVVRQEARPARSAPRF